MIYQLFKEQANLARGIPLGDNQFIVWIYTPEILAPGSETKGGAARACILVMGTIGLLKEMSDKHRLPQDSSDPTFSIPLKLFYQL